MVPTPLPIGLSKDENDQNQIFRPGCSFCWVFGPAVVAGFPPRASRRPAPFGSPSSGRRCSGHAGRDSPNQGGNVFRDAFLSFTLSNAPGIATGKIISDISFPSSEGIAFDRAELTPDVEAAGATLEIEVAEGEDASEAGEEGETAQE